MENPIKMDNLGVPLFLETSHPTTSTIFDEVPIPWPVQFLLLAYQNWHGKADGKDGGKKPREFGSVTVGPKNPKRK